MADDVFVMLTWMADYSKFYSIVVILMCFMAMVIFILRLNSDQIFWPLPSSPVPLIPKREMRSVMNPYVLWIDNLEMTNLHDDVMVRLSCQHPCKVTCLRWVGIDDLHQALQLPSDTLLVELDSSDFLQDSAVFIESYEIKKCSNHNTFVLKYPLRALDLDIGKAPRRNYPLVILLSLPLGLQTIDVEDSDVVLTVYIIHLKDTNCPMKSQIIGHYIKMYNGNIFNLQHLFLTTAESGSVSEKVCSANSIYMRDGSEESQRQDTHDSQTNVEEPSEEDLSDSLCIVCQSAEISTVLLPCRHTCVCHGCFGQIDKCPMCRSVIESYFTLTGTPDVVTRTIPEGASQLTRWERWNNRLNHFLGFTEQQWPDSTIRQLLSHCIVRRGSKLQLISLDGTETILPHSRKGTGSARNNC